MSSPSTPVTPEELAHAKAIMSRAHQSGVKSRSDVTQGYVAMNDSAKRLRDQRDIELDEAWEPVHYSEEHQPLEKERLGGHMSHDQKPVIPEKMDKSKICFPAGVTRLKDWGSTVCRLPKVSKLGLSYQELTSKTEYQSYLIWVQAHGKDRDGRFGDFAAYLSAIDYAGSVNQTTDPTESFPEAATSERGSEQNFHK